MLKDQEERETDKQNEMKKKEEEKMRIKKMEDVERKMKERQEGIENDLRLQILNLNQKLESTLQGSKLILSILFTIFYIFLFFWCL